MLLNEEQQSLIEEEAKKEASTWVTNTHQMIEDKSHLFIVNSFEGFDDDDVEKMKEIYKELIVEEIHNLL